jgi:hypothetical protein
LTSIKKNQIINDVTYIQERNILKMTDDKKINNIALRILTEIGIGVGTAIVADVVQIIRTSKSSHIDIGAWDSAYNNINKMIFNLNPTKYLKHKVPSANKDFYELSPGVSYFTKVDDKNYMRIEAYRDKGSNMIYPEQRVKVSFFGKDKYKNRGKFLEAANRLKNEEFIRVQYLNEYDTTCEIIPHDFDNIVIDDEVKSRIVDGLNNWKDSKSWYKNHQLTYKIGVFLHGDPGTGKSTIAKAISSMFENAPILTIDPNDVMKSIAGILRMRKKYTGTIVILIEDFDMYCKKRKDSDDDQRRDNKVDANQNAIFQLLDGIYSTDNTIYIATTNYKNKLDPALIRYGRFDIQEELKYFDEKQVVSYIKLMGYDKRILPKLNIGPYPVQPSYLQSKIMEYRANNIPKTKKED